MSKTPIRLILGWFMVLLSKEFGNERKRKTKKKEFFEDKWRKETLGPIKYHYFIDDIN